jgi:glycogen debranching enzyme
VWPLGYARETVGIGTVAAEAQQAALAAARTTVELAEKARRAAELDRERQRLDRISELVEAVFWKAQDATFGATDTEWKRARNLLSQALVGRRSEFPECVRVEQSGDAPMAMANASRGRIEVETKRRELEQRAAEVDTETPPSAPS